MPRFPKYGFPFQYYSPYKYRPCTPKPIAIPEKIDPPAPPSSAQKPQEPVWFDLFGIKLYFDDVFILSLLFFLYSEEVKDEGLFLALILLLIS